MWRNLFSFHCEKDIALFCVERAFFIGGVMHKKYIAILAVILCILLCGVFLTACNNGSNDNNDGNNILDDGDYTLKIYGLSSNPIIIEKNQILALGQEKEVVYDENNPCFPSDKTDDDGNPIPHTIKGVYLDDILAEYADGAVSGAYSSIKLVATDPFENILTQNIYSQEHGGSAMIIVYEYDGHTLNPQEKSGALRAVLPNQPANFWVSQLKEIHFENTELTLPKVEKLYFMEMLDSKYYGNFQKQISIGGESIDIKYFGISLNALLKDNILIAQENDKMYITAFDLIIGQDEDTYRDYTSWKTYEYYKNAFLVFEQQEANKSKLPYDRSPLFEGGNILKGMSIKNTLSLSVGHTALMSLKMAFNKYNQFDNVPLADILLHINMLEEDASYIITDTDSQEYTLSREQINSLQISKTNGNYVLDYQNMSLSILSIKKK